MDQEIEARYSVYENMETLVTYFMIGVSCLVCLAYPQKAEIIASCLCALYLVRSLVMLALKSKPSLFNIELERVILSQLTLSMILLDYFGKDEYTTLVMGLMILVLVMKFIPIKALDAHKTYYHNSSVTSIAGRIIIDVTQTLLLILVISKVMQTPEGAVVTLTFMVCISNLMFIVTLSYFSTYGFVQFVFNYMIVTYLYAGATENYRYYIGFMEFVLIIASTIEICIVCFCSTRGETNSVSRDVSFCCA